MARRIVCSMVLFCAWMVAPAQTPSLPVSPELLHPDELMKQGQALLAQAAAHDGSASVTLAEYPTSRTMLSARTRSGGAEEHGHYDDFLIILEGEGTELTGGTIVGARKEADDETRGSHLEGATPHKLHKGDILHIPAGTPHQSIEAPGQSIITFVIKVREAGQ